MWIKQINLLFPDSSVGKESTCNGWRPQFDPWVRKIWWRRERLPTPVFWPREFGQRLRHDWVTFTLNRYIYLPNLFSTNVYIHKIDWKQEFIPTLKFWSRSSSFSVSFSASKSISSLSSLSSTTSSTVIQNVL